MLSDNCNAKYTTKIIFESKHEFVTCDSEAKNSWLKPSQTRLIYLGVPASESASSDGISLNSHLSQQHLKLYLFEGFSSTDLHAAEPLAYLTLKEAPWDGYGKIEARSYWREKQS